MNRINLTKISENIYNFVIEDIEYTTKGSRIFFENISLLKKIKIISASCSFDNSYLYTLPEEKNVNGTIDISDENLKNYNSISIFTYLETKEDDTFKVKNILRNTINFPQVFKSKDFTLNLLAKNINYGDMVSLEIISSPYKKIWLEINNKEFATKTDKIGKTVLIIDSDKITDNSLSVQDLRIFATDKPDNKKEDTGLVLTIIPSNIGKLAVSIDNIPSLSNPTLSSISTFDYPISGVGSGCSTVLTGCNAVSAIPVITGTSSSSSSATNSFSRINSYSVAKLSDNGSIIAISSQNKDLLINTNDISETEQLQKTLASQIWLIWSGLSNEYAASTRNAVVVDNNATIGNCTEALKVLVDADIWADTKLNTVWIIDGTLGKREFKVIEREATSFWYLVATDNESMSIAEGVCFNFVAFNKTCSLSYPINLTSLNPLPYIYVNDEYDPGYVSAINPQITSNKFSAPTEDQYIYIVCEANVSGVTQLFLYGANLTNFDTYGWEQLTYDGENKNPKIALDKRFNLHIVWESSRCNPGQLMYGIIGPSSRNIANEVFISSVDKQAFLSAQLNKENVNENSDKTNIKNKLTQSLIDITTPVALDLRPLDAYGVRTGDMWTEYKTVSGTVSVINNGSITLSGNPSTDKFSAFAALDRDEVDTYFLESWDQLSFQLGFDLTANVAATYYTKNQIKDLYNTFKASFTNTNIAGGINIYTDANSNRYSLSDVIYSYDKIIPIAGSFKAPGVCGDPANGLTSQLDQLELRPFCLAIVPEIARFLASNIESSSEYSARTGLSDYNIYTQEERLTGKFKLALIYESSASVADFSLREQKYQILNILENSFNLTENHNYKIAVHISKLRQEALLEREIENPFDEYGTEDKYRYSTNIILTVDGIAQAAQNISNNYNDNYYQFDIGIGCSLLGEYKPINFKPYDHNLNIDSAVVLDFNNITIGPHSITNDPYLTHLAPFDRNISRMVINTTADLGTSLDTYDETFLTEASYKVSLGLKRSKVQFNQIPITFEGKNISPSIYLDDLNKLYIAWQSDRDSRWEIYYTSSYDSSMPFRFDSRITNYDSRSLSPAIALDTYGRKFITWQDDRNGTFDIFSANSTKILEIDKCTRDYLTYKYGLIPQADDYLGIEDEYGVVSDPTWASICAVKFKITNSDLLSVKMHFLLRMYYDSGFASLAKFLDSRLDISNWYVNGTQLSYDGWTVAPGETIDVEYWITKEDQLENQIYWCRTTIDNGTILEDMDSSFVFYCPVAQKNSCTIPCVYENDSGSDKKVHFKLSFYRDSGYSDLIFDYSSIDDQRKFITGEQKLSTGGLTVSNGGIVSAIYNPEIIPLDIYNQRITTGGTSTDVDTYLNPNYSGSRSGLCTAFFITPASNTAGATNKSGIYPPSIPYDTPYVGIATGQFTVGLETIEVDTITSITVNVYVANTPPSGAYGTQTVYLRTDGGATTIGSQAFNLSANGWASFTVNNPVLTQSQIDDLSIFITNVNANVTKIYAINARIIGTTGVQTTNLQSLICGSNYWVKTEVIDFSNCSSQYVVELSTVGTITLSEIAFGWYYYDLGNFYLTITGNPGNWLLTYIDDDPVCTDTWTCSTDCPSTNVDDWTPVLVGCGHSIVSIVGNNDTLTVLDTTLSEFSCSCSGANYYDWRKDLLNLEWKCSGFGGMDFAITRSLNNSLWSSLDASSDNRIYISWEERVNNVNQIKWSVWDSENDIIYSSAQGFFDKNIGSGYFFPKIIVNNMLNVVNFFSNKETLYKRECSLWKTSEAATQELTYADKDSYIINSNLLDYNSSDLTSCVSIDLAKDSIVDNYYTTDNELIYLVDKCLVNFEINIPNGAFAIRAKNSSTDDYSDWIGIDKHIPSVSGYSSSSSQLEDFVNSYSIGTNKIVFPWVLSPENGTKTVYFEIATHWGKTIEMDYSLITRYRPMNYSVEFYRDSDRTEMASMFENYPVLSSKDLVVNSEDISSINIETNTSKTIYVKVIFNDADYLNELLNFGKTREFLQDNQDLTFNVTLPGQTLYGLALTQAALPSISVDWNGSSQVSLDNDNKAIYEGQFDIDIEDGFYWVDGLGTVTINIPTPCLLKQLKTEKESDRLTTNNLISSISSNIDALTLDNSKFKELYNKDLLCSFTTLSCEDGDYNKTDSFDDEVQDPGDGTGVVVCDSLDWTIPLKGEPCFYLRNSENATNWIEESSVLELDISDSRIIYLKFGIDTDFEDVLFMIKPNENITYTGSNLCLSSDPTGSYSRSISFSVPKKSIAIIHDYIQDQKYYCAGSSECNWASAQKIFTVQGSGTSIATIPQGTALNNGTDGATVWNIPNAVGINVLTSSSSSSNSDGLLQTTTTISVSKDELEQRGFLTSSGILRFKFAYIRSGKGYASIRDVTCGVNC